MKIIITENQKKSLLNESIANKIADSVTKMKNFTKKVISEASEQTGLDFSFLLSWGATLGGLMIPVSQFIEGNHPELSSMDLSLIIIGAITTYYTSNKKIISKLLDEIKKRGLIDIFDEVLSATENLKNVFLSFVESLNITVNRMSNMLAYTFIIPLLPQLLEIAQSGFDENLIRSLSMRLAGYGVVTISSTVLKNLITKIIKRFRS
jgi:hypothetical protein